MERPKVQVRPADRARIWARRRSEREQLLALGRQFAGSMRLEGLQAVVVFGSVARGDFNLWSDVDVLVLAEPLPDRLLERLDLLRPAVPRVQAVAWTPEELGHRLRRRDPIALEAYARGVVVRGTLPAPARLAVDGGREGTTEP